MKHVAFKDLHPQDLEIDPVNERVSNASPFSEDGESLQESIEDKGVIEPIVVREVDEQYMVVAGQRRTLAAQATGQETIPARIMEMDDTEARMVSIIENADQFNKDVPKSDRADAIRALMNNGYSLPKIADEMNVSEPTIRRWVEPALEYWEGTSFEANPENNDSNLNNSDVSLQAMKIIRQETEYKEHREDLAQTVVEENIKNSLVREASNRAESPEGFEEEIDRIVNELNSSKKRIRQEISLVGDITQHLENEMKNRGVGEKELIEMLVTEKIEEIQLEKEGKLIKIPLDDEIDKALSDAIGQKDIPKKALAKVLIRRKLQQTGHLEDD